MVLCSTRSGGPARHPCNRASLPVQEHGHDVIVRLHVLSDLHLEQRRLDAAGGCRRRRPGGRHRRPGRAAFVGAWLGRRAPGAVRRRQPRVLRSCDARADRRASPCRRRVVRARARERRGDPRRRPLPRLHPVERLRLRRTRAPGRGDATLRAGRQRLRAHHVRSARAHARGARHADAAPLQSPLACRAARRSTTTGRP